MPAAPETIFARDGLPLLAARLAELGTARVLILAAPSRRFVDATVAALARFDPTVFDGARVHVPGEVVDRAAAALVACGADTLVSIGGGSTIGLGKALRLAHAVRFAAVPTTYSGSEMTSIHGVTRDGAKLTGRDPRVRPDVVLYDATLSASLPVTASVQGLFNALAHPISALSTGSLAGDDRARGFAAVTSLMTAIETLLRTPGDLGAREAALRGASAAGALLDRGRAGAQHALAHLLGGSLDLDHAALHAVLLPHFVAHLRATDAPLVDDLERAAGGALLEASLHGMLVRARAPTSLDALGADAEAVRRLLAARPDLPSSLALAAQHGDGDG